MVIIIAECTQVLKKKTRQLHYRHLKIMGEVSELNYCLKEGATCVFLAREQVTLPGVGKGGPFRTCNAFSLPLSHK